MSNKIKFYKCSLSEFSNSQKNLIVILTTTQSPHLEAYFHFIQENIKKYKSIYILNATAESIYRNEYTWRSYVPLRQNFIRKTRNGFFKNLFIKKKIQDLGFKVYSLKIKKNCILNEAEIFAILKTYTMTEFRTAAFTSTAYDKEIINSISFISSAINQFTTTVKVSKKDDFLIFNGRHPLEFSARQTLQKLNYRRIFYHECNNYAYKIYYTNFQIHQLSSYRKLINDYKSANANLLNKWYLSKNLKIKKSFKKKYVVYFTSSFDEFSFAYNKPINQPLLISKLLFNKTVLPLRIRVHPNTINKSINDRLYWDFLKSKFGEIIINYDEDINSYDLIKESFFTISIGSSIAPESLMLGVNHLLCGTQHIYSGLPGFYRCSERNFIEVINFLFERRRNLKKISNNSKEFAAASQLFNKEIGESVSLAFLGAYPFKLPINNFFGWVFKNFRK